MPFCSELQGVRSFSPGYVVDQRIQVLNGELRSVAVRTNVQIHVEQCNIGEAIQTGISEVSGWRSVRIPVETNANFVAHIGIEGVVFARSEEVIRSWRRQKECGQTGSGVNRRLLVVNVTNAELVFLGDVPVSAEVPGLV